MREPVRIHRARAAARVQRALHRVRTAQSAEDALELGLHETCATLGFQRAVLSLVRGDELVVEDVRIAHDPQRAARALERIGGAAVSLGELPDERRAVRSGDAILVPRPEASRLPDRITAIVGRGAYVAAPIACGDDVVAIIHADDPDSADHLTEADRDCLWAFSEGLSLLIGWCSAIERQRFRQTELDALLRAAERAARNLGKAGPEGLEPRFAGVELVRAPSAAPGALTGRETEVIELMALGATNREIAARLVISEATVKSHATSILRKLEAHTRAEAVSKFVRAAPAEVA